MSHAKNLIDRGLFAPYPGTGTPFSAEEVRQLLRASAHDVNQSDAPYLEPAFVGTVLSVLALGARARCSSSDRATTRRRPSGTSSRATAAPNAPTLLDLVTDTTIPPEADLSGSVRWFDIVDPVRTPSFAIRGSARRCAPATTSSGRSKSAAGSSRSPSRCSDRARAAALRSTTKCS